MEIPDVAYSSLAHLNSDQVTMDKPIGKIKKRDAIFERHRAFRLQVIFRLLASLSFTHNFN